MCGYLEGEEKKLYGNKQKGAACAWLRRLQCALRFPGLPQGATSSTGDGLAGWAPVRLAGLPGCVCQRCEIRQLEALAAAQRPAVWLESCRCRLGDSDVLQIKHLRCAGAYLEAAESRAVTGACAGICHRAELWLGTGPGHCACSLCPGELIWLFGCSHAHHSHFSGGGYCLRAVACSRQETWLAVPSVSMM